MKTIYTNQTVTDSGVRALTFTVPELESESCQKEDST